MTNPKCFPLETSNFFIQSAKWKLFALSIKSPVQSPFLHAVAPTPTGVEMTKKTFPPCTGGTNEVIIPCFLFGFLGSGFLVVGFLGSGFWGSGFSVSALLRSGFSGSGFLGLRLTFNYYVTFGFCFFRFSLVRIMMLLVFW